MKAIEVVLVHGDQQTVVARGAADDGYFFEVDVVVPIETFPGEARILALDAASGLTASGDTDRPLTITPDLPLAADRATALFNGSDQRPSTTIMGTTTDDPDRSEATSKPPPRQVGGDDTGGTPSAVKVVGLGLLAAVVITAAVMLVQRRRVL